MTIGPVIIDIDGTTLSQEDRQLLCHPLVGGVILFSRNIDSYSQLKQLNADIRQLNPDLLLCVDQEGGRVQRCRDGFTQIPPMQVFDRLYQQDPALAVRRAQDCGWLLAAEILAVGFDFSFTPVLDVDESFCSVIGDRSFSSKPALVSELGRAFIQGAHSAGMPVTGKHFPGHGSVVGDSHLELPVDPRALNEIQEKDLLPFALLAEELEAVMPAHIIFDQVDAKAPVGFSKIWLQDILRQEMNYDGVIFSDDLTMEGAAKTGSYADRAFAAFEAGCDSVLVCNNREGAKQVITALEQSDVTFDDRRLKRMRGDFSLGQPDMLNSERWKDVSEWLVAQTQDLKR